MTITDKVSIQFFDIKQHARVGPIHFLLADAGVSFDTHRISQHDWLHHRQELIRSNKSPYGGLPVVEVDGRSYTQLLPTLRYLARRVGKYHAHGAEDEYLIDAAADVALDWINDYSKAHIAPSANEGIQHRYRDEQRPRYAHAINHYLSRHNGPFLLGNEVSYADFVIFSIIVDNKDFAHKDYPHIEAFVHNFEKREGVRHHLEQHLKH
ncbi:hypothetical protein THASP1DRAFT_22934 [Thamnocephalis sphaerospora]|uniref:Glutathione S-transferase n=1 Tax=Thamnocephalis sphaerospora TaxID=78915 RepID=A0A4P9XST0_9FUNG|nr:hypothetical protein THASP1DRAFT_22934 [Thamnocephalis sphaerospora]|eukprot:RKP09187.1 hypothetical protein THASP1DRAFT_22934 [Thamnocephalis sphaerospora]